MKFCQHNDIPMASYVMPHREVIAMSQQTLCKRPSWPLGGSENLC